VCGVCVWCACGVCVFGCGVYVLLCGVFVCVVCVCVYICLCVCGFLGITFEATFTSLLTYLLTLDDSSVSMLLKSCASLKFFRVFSFLVGLKTYQHPGINIETCQTNLIQILTYLFLHILL